MYLIKSISRFLFCIVSIMIIFEVDSVNSIFSSAYKDSPEYKVRSKLASLSFSDMSADYSNLPSENEFLGPYHRKIYDNFVPLLFPRHVPSEFCGVHYITYNSTGFKIEHDADLGNVLDNEVTEKPPNVDYIEDGDDYFTIIMIDVDAPSRENPVHRHWLHWMVTNVNDWYTEGGHVIAEYVGPWPQKGTGIHRYVVLVYEQNRKDVFNETVISKDNFSARRNFNHYEFSKKYNLCEPVASNFFTAQWSPFVDKRYKKYFNS